MLGCQETGGPSSDAGRVRLQLSLANVLSGETLEIRPSYRRSDQSVIALESSTVALEDGNSQTVTIQVDVTSCLADPAREGGGPGCPLRIVVTLRSAAGELIDAATIGPLDAVPGAAVQAPAATLRHIETITLTAPGPTFTIGTPATVTAQVRDRANTTLAGIPLVWSSTNVAVASVSQAGVVTPLSPGATQIRAVIADRPSGPLGSLAITVEFPSSALIGPAGGTVLSGNGRLTLTIPPGAIATPTLVTIQPLAVDDPDRVVGTLVYQIAPIGLTLLQPATGTITYNTAEIPGGVRNESALRLFFVAPGDSSGRVTAGSSVNTGAHAVTGSVTVLNLLGAGLAVVGVRSLTVGPRHVCVALSTGQGFCWGRGASGELGNGLGQDSPDPVRVQGNQDWSVLSAGQDFTCGLTTSGQVWCWGANASGQLGLNGITPALTPTQLSLPSVAWLEAGWNHACAADQSARVYCWGNNVSNQLGVTSSLICGTQPCTTLPTLLPASTTATSLSLGLQFTCAVSGTFQGCWGSNSGGQLGISNITPNSLTPLAPPAGAPGAFTRLASGNLHTCGLLTNGAAWCWGANGSGRMGNGSAAGGNSLPPQAVVGGLFFAMLDAGGTNSTLGPVCGVTLTGDGYCWGSNSNGQLGTTTGGPFFPCVQGVCSATPSPVANVTGFSEIHGGNDFACGLQVANGIVYCWGAGTFGQLGDGSSSDSPIPRRVH